MSGSRAQYRLENLQRFYIRRAEIVKAIDGIDLVINSGEFIAVLGPSGSGKTTLLNILAGLDKNTGGSIYLDDRDLLKLNDSKLCDIRQFDIGIIFQFYNMHPSFTAQENVEYPMMIAKVPRDKRQTRAINLLQQVGLYDKRDNFPSELSGGEKQRVGIARALANDPKIIIADEPTGDLDSEHAAAIIDLLLEINKDGKTVIMVTHDETLLTEDMRVLNLIDGRITPFNPSFISE
ncbi:MAG: ABC transporter ATP-binding protein [Candidatus Hodarchaeales archaeon]|jgi:putative ABC transport system ATP-binding protein